MKTGFVLHFLLLKVCVAGLSDKPQPKFPGRMTAGSLGL